MREQTPKRRPAGAAVLQPTVTAAISTAMFEELAEVGYSRMSMDAVARRASVGKAALYRRWPSKQAMVIELVDGVVREHGIVLPDTGSLPGDIEAYIRATRDQLGRPLVARIVSDMFGEVARNPALAAAVRQALAAPRRQAGTLMLQRAVDRGELPTDLDHRIALDLLIAPVSFRVLLMPDPTDDDYVHRLAMATTAAIKAAHT